MKKKILCLAITLSLAAAFSFNSFALTKDELKAAHTTEYTTGTGSVYGPALTQEQLDAVAQVAADFATNYIKDGMSDNDKIREMNTYLFKTVSYAEDWSKNSANTAYGALINHTAQCSGFARAFKALCDAVGIECYYVEADQYAWNPNHQWNIVKYNGQYYHMDVQENALGKGGDSTYLSATHVCTYDKSKYPQVASADADVPRYYDGQGPYAITSEDIQVAEFPGQQKIIIDFPSQAAGPVGIVDYGVCQAAKLPDDVGTMVVEAISPYDETQYNMQVAIIPYKGQKTRETGKLYLDLQGNYLTNFQILRKGQPVSIDPLGQNRSAAEIADYCRKNDIFFEIVVFDGNAFFKYEKEHGQVTVDNLLKDIPGMVTWVTY